MSSPDAQKWYSERCLLDVGHPRLCQFPDISLLQAEFNRVIQYLSKYIMGRGKENNCPAGFGREELIMYATEIVPCFTNFLEVNCQTYHSDSDLGLEGPEARCFVAASSGPGSSPKRTWGWFSKPKQAEQGITILCLKRQCTLFLNTTVLDANCFRLDSDIIVRNGIVRDTSPFECCSWRESKSYYLQLHLHLWFNIIQPEGYQ